MTSPLTSREYWDRYWDGVSLPAEAQRRAGCFALEHAILDMFDRHLPKQVPFSVLEIGGAPGRYLAYIARNRVCHAAALDYSPIGCTKTRANFDMLGLDVSVYERDLFESDDLPQFDVVFSLGFIEHFSDVTEVVHSHLKRLKAQGTLILGLPNLLGINRCLARTLAPSLLQSHNLEVMNVDAWTGFEQRFGLTRLFRGYIGGFEPATISVCESSGAFARSLALALRALRRVFRRRICRQFNSKYVSGYAFGVYRFNGFESIPDVSQSARSMTGDS